MKTYDYTKDSQVKKFFDSLPPEKTEENYSNDVFDVDKHAPKKTKISAHHPSSSEAWKKKLENEDEYIRNIC